MPWPLFLLLPIILVIAGIAIAPDLLTNPKGYVKERKISRQVIKMAKREEPVFAITAIVVQAPTNTGYHQYVISGVMNVWFKKSSIYFNAFGLIKFAARYGEIEMITMEKRKYARLYPQVLTFKIKDKPSLMLRIKEDESIIQSIEKAVGITIIR